LDEDDVLTAGLQLLSYQHQDFQEFRDLKCMHGPSCEAADSQNDAKQQA